MIVSFVGNAEADILCLFGMSFIIKVLLLTQKFSRALYHK